MIKDIECPYCGNWQEIKHDDGYGYSEDELYFQECGDCGKEFGYYTTISYYYEPKEIPCKNGGGHSYKQMFGAPKEYFVGRYRCEYCDEEKVDEELNKKAMQGYLKSLKDKEGNNGHIRS